MKYLIILIITLCGCVVSNDVEDPICEETLITKIDTVFVEKEYQCEKTTVGLFFAKVKGFGVENTDILYSSEKVCLLNAVIIDPFGEKAEIECLELKKVENCKLVTNKN